MRQSTEIPEKGAAVPAAPYNEHVDKSHKRQDSWPQCARWVLAGQCDEGHVYSKVLMCGKEWCPDCGEEHSWIHNRRVARWLPKLQQMESAGYWVIEWPLHSRDKLKNPDELSRIGKSTKRAFQYLGYDRGLRRWHWFGDEAPATNGWNPHLNILVDGASLPKAQLENIKTTLRKWLNEPDLIIHYSFRTTPRRMTHALNYVTRATFRQVSWDPVAAQVVDGFHNSQTWGTWQEPQKWHSSREKELLKPLEAGRCPKCGGVIHWDSQPMHADIFLYFLDKGMFTPLGGGYYESSLSPPPRRDPAIPIGHTSEVREAKDYADIQRLEIRLNHEDKIIDYYAWLSGIYEILDEASQK